MRHILAVDSHTGGEPTRIIYDGAPALDGATMADRLECFRLKHDWLRRVSVEEPRGSDILVGALITPPVSEAAGCGIIFFNNVGYLGMCGHGTIGLLVTLNYLGRLEPGSCLVDTPVGPVTATLHENGLVSLDNVPCHARQLDLTVQVPDLGEVCGDLVWGGNWFFILEMDERFPELTVDNSRMLTAITLRIREALHREGFNMVDHVEVSGPPLNPQNNSRNFVLCPGDAYDRSPCGTGTSARVAALVARGQLEKDRTWRQESITGSVFSAEWREAPEKYQTAPFMSVIPTITGSARITGALEMIVHPDEIDSVPSGTTGMES